jgi:hypothetical protein
MPKAPAFEFSEHTYCNGGLPSITTQDGIWAIALWGDDARSAWLETIRHGNRQGESG